MARRFNGTSDFIAFTLSSVLQPLDAGPMTLVILASITSTTDGGMIHARTSGATNSWWMECSATQWNYGQGVAARDVGDLTTSEGWAVYAGHKANGGAAQPVGRKVILGGATTENTAASGLADGTAPGAGGFLQVGKWGTASEFLGADIAACAIWDVELSQAEIDSLATSYANWSATATAPKWLVHFNQANATDAITDDSGNGGGSSSITGTTIVANPSGFFGGTGATATPATVHGVGEFPAATVSAGSTLAPTTVHGIGEFPAATVSAGSAVAPTTVHGVGEFPAATVSAGSTAAPATVSGVGEFPAATASAGSTAAPATVSGIGEFPAATIAAGSTASPATVSGIGEIPAPAVSAGGGSTAAPTTLSGVGSLPAPTVTATTVVSAVTVSGAGHLPAPAVEADSSATATPGTLSGTGHIGTPAVSTGGGAPAPVLTHIVEPPMVHVDVQPLQHIAVQQLVHVG